MEGFYFFTLGTGVFIDEVADTFKACQLQSVGVSEGKAADRACPVVPFLGGFYLVVQQDDLGTGAAENFVDGSDLAQDSVGVFHVDSL